MDPSLVPPAMKLAPGEIETQLNSTGGMNRCSVGVESRLIVVKPARPGLVEIRAKIELDPFVGFNRVHVLIE